MNSLKLSADTPIVKSILALAKDLLSFTSEKNASMHRAAAARLN
jgi:hypothetical protein